MTRKQLEQIPDELLDGGHLAASTGSYQDGWFTQEDFGAVRLSLHASELLHDERTPYQHIAIYDTAYFGRVLTLDGTVMLTERDEFAYHEMIAHVPLCTLPEPRDVLIIGGGDCGTLREVLRHPGIERVVQCEIDECVTRACRRHLPWVDGAIRDPRAELVFADGTRYVGDHERSFDLVIVDSTDPRDLAIGLYLEEFYALVCRALKPGGVMTAQAETPFWAASMVRAMYEQIRGAFRYATGYLAWIPTYSSGCWNLAYASNGRTERDHFAADRAEEVTRSSRYYNARVHAASFALPNFARDVIEHGRNPFSVFEQRARANGSGRPPTR